MQNTNISIKTQKGANNVFLHAKHVAPRNMINVLIVKQGGALVRIIQVSAGFVSVKAHLVNPKMDNVML